MARLESKAKAGFYPTPDIVVGHIAQALVFEGKTRAFDPCCGEGKVSEIVQGKAETFGIELDIERYRASLKKLHHVLLGDALNEVKVSKHCMGLLFLNPPYDFEATDITDMKAQRLEERFLRRFMGTLQENGVLVFIIPYTVLKYTAKTLSRNFSDIRIYVFPEKEFAGFRQCVVVARRSRLVKKSEAQRIERTLIQYAHLGPDAFLQAVPGTSSMQKITVPSVKQAVRIFRSERIDPGTWLPKLKTSTVLDALLKRLAPTPRDRIKPLAPLLQGHLAQVLAAGYMNGELKKNGKHLVIKGCVTKSEVTHSVEDRKNSKGEQYSLLKIRDRFNITVKTIDMQTATLLEIK